MAGKPVQAQVAVRAMVLASALFAATITVREIYEFSVRMVYRNSVTYHSVRPARPEVRVGDQIFFVSDREISASLYKMEWDDRISCSDSPGGDFVPKAVYRDHRFDVPASPRADVAWPFDGYRVPPGLDGLWCRGWHQIQVFPVKGVSLPLITVEGTGVFRVLPRE